MTVATQKPNTIKLDEVKARASALGIKPGKIKKADLIHIIQQAEGNTPCFGTCNGWCAESECCWMADCVKVKS